MIRLILGQTSLHQRLETVDEQLDILRVAVGLGEGPGEPPEAAEATALQEVKLLLAGVLAADHVLDDALHRRQDRLVVTQGQHVSDLCVQQRVNHRENLKIRNKNICDSRFKQYFTLGNTTLASARYS